MILLSLFLSYLLALLDFIIFAIISPNFPLNMIKHLLPLIVLLRNKGVYAFPLHQPSYLESIIALYQQENQRLYQQQKELQKLKIFEMMCSAWKNKDDFLPHLENCANILRS